jgi:hypothetical protein
MGDDVNDYLDSLDGPPEDQMERWPTTTDEIEVPNDEDAREWDCG